MLKIIWFAVRIKNLSRSYDMKNILLILLVLVAIAMIALGIINKMPPPALTGIGFIIIAGLFYDKESGS